MPGRYGSPVAPRTFSPSPPQHIERLDLSRQELAELPPEIAKLVNLRVLTCYDNGLKMIPPEIGAPPLFPGQLLDPSHSFQASWSTCKPLV